MKKKEKCIMPKSDLWETKREEGLCRHEIFESSARQKSIEDGLVIFITHEQHFGKNGRSGFQYDQELKQYVEYLAMETWNKTYKGDFKDRYTYYIIKPDDYEEWKEIHIKE